MTRRAVFLDVDGTYANDRGLVPDSARQAVVRARANGHLVFLCTGRSKAELWDGVLDAGFDGVIASGGAYIELDGRTIADYTIPVDLLRRAVEFFDTHEVDYYLQSRGGIYARPHARAVLAQLVYAGVTDEQARLERRRGLGGFTDSLIVDADLLRPDINKISFLDSGLPLETVRTKFEGDFDIIPATVPAFGPNSGEMSLPGVHKGSAIETVLRHIGMTREDAVAFGDGHNDLEMLQYVGMGVAMAGAHRSVKAVADAVTDGGPDDDALAAGFAALRLV